MLVWNQARRIIILVVGVSVMLVGAILIVLPGPAFIVIPAGLAILATEFVWARRLLRRMKKTARDLIGRGKSDNAAESASLTKRGPKGVPTSEFSAKK